MRKREMQTAAKELNKLLNPTPKIDPDGKKLKDQLIEAGSLVVDDDLDELSKSTVAVLKELQIGPFEEEEQGEPETEAQTEPEQEETQANFDSPDENTPALTETHETEETASTADSTKEENDDLKTVLARAKKLADLKEIVQNYDEFKKLRKKLDDYTGIAGIRELKAKMKKLAGIKESAPTSSGSGKKGERKSSGYNRVTSVVDSINSFGKKPFTQEDVRRKSDQIYVEKTGKEAFDTNSKRMHPATHIVNYMLSGLVAFGVFNQDGKQYQKN